MTPFRKKLDAFFGFYNWLAVLALSYTLLCGLDFGEVIHYDKIERLTSVVKQGDSFKVKYTFRRLRTCELLRVRIIIDGASTHHEISREYFPGYGNITDPGHSEEMEVKVPISADLTPGVARYRAILSHECPIHIGPLTITNIFAQFTPNVQILPDLPFVILPADK